VTEFENESSIMELSSLKTNLEKIALVEEGINSVEL
jgi:hypothetical protein